MTHNDKVTHVWAAAYAAASAHHKPIASDWRDENGHARAHCRAVAAAAVKDWEKFNRARAEGRI